VLVWLNGRVVPARAARVSALDRGLLHGDGVYDTWRTYGGEPFAVAAHIARLAAAARRLGLPPPGPARAWVQRSRLLVRRLALPDAALRLTITRGAAGEALLPERAARPTVLLLARPLPGDLAARQERGVSAALLPFPRDAAGPWGALKLVGHASAIAGRAAAVRRGADEGLYTTASGEVTEGTTTNLWLVEKGTLVTPPLASGVLPGVTRALVLALARRAGIAVREEPLAVARVRRARELFLTASTIEVVPVVRLDGRRVGDGRPGATTRQLHERYRAHVCRALALRARGKPVRRERAARRGEVLR
jgi:branched-subunit amino acid aminotransferase/4-amino-4-deoxychorismate lyase